MKIYRPVEGFPYEVSNEGDVRRAGPKGKAARVGRVLQGWLEPKTGYIKVTLRGDRKIEIGVHVLVCRAFHGPKPSPDHEAAHEDGNPAHNYEGNLRWATRKENAEDMVRHGRSRRGERGTAAKLTLAQASEILTRRSAGEGGRLLAKEFNISEQVICNIFKRRTWPELNVFGNHTL